MDNIKESKEYKLAKEWEMAVNSFSFNPKWKSHSTLTLLATQNYPFLLKYDCPLWLK